MQSTRHPAYPWCTRPHTPLDLRRWQICGTATQAQSIKQGRDCPIPPQTDGDGRYTKRERRRRRRAERRGYFCSVPSGFRHVLVEAPLRQQARVMVQSFAQHAEDERLTGAVPHYVRDAAAGAVRCGYGCARSLAHAFLASSAKRRPSGSSIGVLFPASKQPAAQLSATASVYVPLAERPDDFVCVRRFS